MSEIQVCEGIWRNRCGQRLVIIRCDPVDGQQWTDGLQHYSDDGTYCANNRGQDLVVFVGLLPDKSQADRAAEIERRLAAVTKQNEQAQRYVSDANEALNEKTATIYRLRTELEQAQAWRTAATDAHSQVEAQRIEQTAEIARLKAEWQSEFTAAQQLRSQVEQLERLLDDARENLEVLREDREAAERHCEGAKSAFLAVIKTLTGGRA